MMWAMHSKSHNPVSLKKQIPALLQTTPHVLNAQSKLTLSPKAAKLED